MPHPIQKRYQRKQIDCPFNRHRWTWDDLRNAAQKLSIIEANGRVKRYGIAIEAGKWGLWVNQNKGALLDDFRNPSKCTLTDPAALQAIEFFSSLLNDRIYILAQRWFIRGIAMTGMGGR